MSITRYARVSAQDQDLTSQLQALQTAECDPIYQEKATGADMERAEWKSL
ncbi:recombinase family protein [uncultured Actinomyces sp.]|nr:recombinase family protein [uncultured Actinomyces sp.]